MIDFAKLCAPLLEAYSSTITATRAAGDFRFADKLQRERNRLTKLVTLQSRLEASTTCRDCVRAGGLCADHLYAGGAAPRSSEPAAALLSVVLEIWTFPEKNLREHHMQRHKRMGDQRPVVRMAMRTHAARRGVRVRPPCVVRLTRLAPDGLDDDNLRGSLSAVRDGVADWLGTDDSARSGIEFRYGQESARRHGVRIEVST